MTLTLVMVLVVFATVLAMLGWTRTAHELFGMILLLFLVIGCGAVPKLLVKPLQAPYAIRPPLNWAPSNVIVLLTAGSTLAPEDTIEPSPNAFARIDEAVVLYRQCRLAAARCVLLVAGGDASHVGTPLSVTYAQTMLALGVPADDMVLETRSMNTWQNAQYTRPLLQIINAQKVWLVTSAVHLRRSVLYFNRFGIAVTPVRADYLRGLWAQLPVAYNFAVTDAALHEYGGIAAYHLYEVLGWNAKTAPPLTALQSGGPQPSAQRAATQRAEIHGG